MCLVPSTRPRPTVAVATDGSHLTHAAGFAFYADDGTCNYGPANIDENAELTAIEAAITTFDPHVPLVIQTDSNEAILRFRDLKAPRLRNANLEQIARIFESIAARPESVDFVQIKQSETVHAHHAVAHYLAFLGRVGECRVPGAPVPGLVRILAAVDPNSEAHLMVREHLFPRHMQH